MLQADRWRLRGTLSRSPKGWALLATVLVAGSLLLGVSTSVLPGSVGIALAAGIALVIAGVVLPERWLVYLVLISAIFGFVPVSDISGYQIEVEYPLVLIAFLRVLLNGHLAEGLRSRGWRLFALASAGLIVATSVSVVHAAIDPDPSLTATQILIAYGKWLAPFLLLPVLIADTREGRPSLAKPLLICLLLTVLADSAITLVTSAGNLSSLRTQAASRASFSTNIGPNRTGVLADIAFMAAIGLATLRWYRPLVIFSLPILAAVVYLSGSRETLVTLAVVGVIYLLRVRPVRLRLTIFGWVIVAGLLVGFAIAADPALIPQSLLRTPNYAFTLPTSNILGIAIPGSLALRLYLNLSGLLIFAHNPLLGLGFDHSLNILTYSESGVLLVNSPAHDSFISVAAQNGILAFLALLAFTAVLLVLAFGFNERDRPRESYLTILALQCAILVIIVDSLATDFIYYDPRAMFVLVAVVVAIIDEGRRYRTTRQVVESSGSTDQTRPATSAPRAA